MSGQPPFGSEWGGWAMHGCPSSQKDAKSQRCNTTEDLRNGAPGRGPLQQPWDSLKGPNEEGLTPS